MWGNDIDTTNCVFQYQKVSTFDVQRDNGRDDMCASIWLWMGDIVAFYVKWSGGVMIFIPWHHPTRTCVACLRGLHCVARAGGEKRKGRVTVHPLSPQPSMAHNFATNWLTVNLVRHAQSTNNALEKRYALTSSTHNPRNTQHVARAAQHSPRNMQHATTLHHNTVHVLHSKPQHGNDRTRA